MQVCPPRVLPVPAAPSSQSFEMCCRCPDLKVQLSIARASPRGRLMHYSRAAIVTCYVTVFLALFAVTLIQLVWPQL